MGYSSSHSREHRSLHRLLNRREAESLLATFKELLPGAALGLVGADGRLLARAGEVTPDSWDHLASMPGRLAKTGTGEAVWVDNWLCQPFLVDSCLVGWLVGHGPIQEQTWLALHRSLAMLLTEAMARRDLARETLERYREINLLYSIGETIGACLDVTQIPELVLAEARQVISADAGVVLLPATDGKSELVVKASLGLPDDVATLLSVSAEVIGRVWRSGRPQITDDSTTGQASLGTTVCVPFKGRDQLLGVILLGRLAGQAVFTAGDEKLVMALASQAAIAIEKARLHQQEIQRQRLEEELSVGRQIQLSLLPNACPVVPGWEFSAIYRAARQVGGDLYDFFDLSGETHRLGLVIADVTGKGVPAALFMAFSRTIIRAEAMTGRSPAAVLNQANRLIVQDNRSRLFLSAFYAILDFSVGRLVFGNAGHNRPLWWQAATGELQELVTAGTILGAFKNSHVEESQVDMAPGDLIVFYTDGVTEARNASGELFGEERLQRAILTACSAGVEQVIQEIVNQLQTFSGETPQTDDFTLFVIKRQADPAVCVEAP